MKRSFKNDLKQEFESKVPNVLDKIEIERVVIKEAPEKTKFPFKRKLRYSVLSILSIFMVVLVVALAMTGSKTKLENKALKESKTVMSTALAASQASSFNQTASFNLNEIKVSDDDSDEVEFDTHDWFDQDVFNDVEKYIPLIETHILDHEVTFIEDENYDILLKLEYEDLNKDLNYIYISYNEEELEDGTKKITGILKKKDDQEELSGTILTDGTVKLNINGAKITSSLKNKRRVNKVESKYLKYSYSYYEEEGKMVYELKTGVLANVVYRFIKEDTPRGHKVISQIEYKDLLGLGLSIQGQVEIEASETKYHFKYSGKVELLGQEITNYKYSVSRPKK